MSAIKTEAPCGGEVPEGEFTVQQAAARTGLSEHTLRYYERAGLLRPIRRQNSSGHRRYSAEDVARITTLACLRATGMPLDQMRRYFELSSEGQRAAPALRNLLETQRDVLEDRIAQMRWHLEYVERKIEYWTAVESGDEAATAKIVRDLEQQIRDHGPRANGIHQREEAS
jgi:DNA-binding transcriptional MerR regulator